MVFEDRIAKYPGRWTMVKSDGTSEVVTLVRNDEPTKEGTPINAKTLNELSTVAGAINAKEEAVSAASSAQTAAANAGQSAQAASEDAGEAASSAAAAKASADKAAAAASTDKTLTIEGAPADAKTVGDALKDIKLPIATATTLGGVKVGSGLAVTADGTLFADSALAAYPVGSIFQTVSVASPAALFGGSWEQIASERVLMGASSSHAAGTTVEAGLPNITGTVTNFAKEFSGAFTQGALVDNKIAAGTGTNRYAMNFNASNSNAIYGASSTVQPAAYYVYIWHRVA